MKQGLYTQLWIADECHSLLFSKCSLSSVLQAEFSFLPLHFELGLLTCFSHWNGSVCSVREAWNVPSGWGWPPEGF